MFFFLQVHLAFHMPSLTALHAKREAASKADTHALFVRQKLERDKAAGLEVPMPRACWWAFAVLQRRPELLGGVPAA